MADQSVEKDDGGFVIGLLIGGLIGAGSAVLFTTDAGRRLREKLAKYTPELHQDLEQLAQELKSGEKKLEQKGAQLKEFLEEELGATPLGQEMETRVNKLQSAGRSFVKALHPKIAKRFFQQTSTRSRRSSP